MNKSRIDWMITLVPFILIMALAVYLFIFPDQANGVISKKYRKEKGLDKD